MPGADGIRMSASWVDLLFWSARSAWRHDRVGCAVVVSGCRTSSTRARLPIPSRLNLQRTVTLRSYTVKPILAAVALVSAMSGAQAAPTVDEYKAQFAAALKNHDPTQTAEGVFQPFIDNSDKTDYQTQLNLGLAVLSHKHVIGALEVLGPAAKLNPTDPVVHGALGLAYRGVGDHDRAIAEYRLALEHGKGVHPETLNWATHLGWLLVSKLSLRGGQ